MEMPERIWDPASGISEDKRNRPLRKRHDFTASTREHGLVGRGIQGFGKELHRAVDEGEVSSARVLAAEPTVRRVGRIVVVFVERVVTGTPAVVTKRPDRTVRR